MIRIGFLLFFAAFFLVAGLLSGFIPYSSRHGVAIASTMDGMATGSMVSLAIQLWFNHKLHKLRERLKE